ncbi:MAG: HD domain-containing phosphohydrolase [Candidatus Aquicultor sp.]
MSVRKRILITGLILSALIAIMGVIGVLSLNKYERKTERLTSSIALINAVQNERAEFQALNGTLNRYFLTNDSSYIEEFLARLPALNDDAKRLARRTDCTACLKGFKATSNDLEKLKMLAQDLKTNAAKYNKQVVHIKRSTIKSLIHTISNRLADSAKMTEEETAEIYKDSHAAYAFYKLFMMLACIITIILGIGISHLLARDIAHPIKELSRATREFANGNRSKRIETGLPSDFSSLADSFNQMAATIQSSERQMKKLNALLAQEVGEQRGMLEIANKETKQRMQEIKAYLEIAEALNSTLSLDDTLEHTAVTLSSVFGADYTAITLIDEDSLSHCWEVEGCNKTECPAYKSTNLECWTLNRTHCENLSQVTFSDKITGCVHCRVFHNLKMKVKATAGLDKEIVASKEFSTHDSTCGQALLTLRPAARPDLTIDPHIISFRNVVPDCTSQISFPLITKNRVLGTIVFGYKAKQVFNKKEIELIGSLCNQIAIGIENATLFKQIKRSATEFSTLYQAGKTLSSLTKLEDISKHALKYSMEISHAEAGIALLFNRKTEKLRITAAKNVDRRTKAIIGKSIGEGPAGWVAKTREPLLIDERYAKHDFKLDKVRSAVFTPFQYNGQLYGVIGLLSFSSKPFTYNDMQLLSTIASQAATEMHNTDLFNQLEDIYIDTVKAFVQAIEAKDSYTKGHSENVADYAVAIAQEMGMEKEQLKTLKTASLLHDIGKIGIKEEILNKPARLNNEEYEHIKQHPHIAFQILEHVPTLKEIADIILYHHEKYDGTGYLMGLQGEDIPLEARILAVVDTFDAMTSSRPYREAASIETARTELLKNAGTQFDPKIVEVFVDLLDKGELGGLVSKQEAKPPVDVDEEADEIPA